MSIQLSGQDTTYAAPQWPAYVIAGGFMSGGVYLDFGGRKEGVRDWVRERYDVSTTNLDDLLQHSPILMLYGMDLATRKSRYEVARQTRHLLVSQALTIGTSLALKGITKAPRPNGGSLSFPSGHTAYTFASATVIYHSYKDENKFLAFSGYVPAVVVGAYRMIKDKHWVSDVVFGAGMGMLFTHLSYHLNIWDSAMVRTGRSDQAGAELRLGGTNNGAGLVLTF